MSEEAQERRGPQATCQAPHGTKNSQEEAPCTKAAAVHSPRVSQGSISC